MCMRWVSVLAISMNYMTKVDALLCSWLVQQAPIFFQSDHLVAMVREFEELSSHFPTKMLNVGFLTLEEGIVWLVGDEDVRDFLVMVLAWGYLVLPTGPKLSYPIVGFVKDGAGLYHFGYVTDFVKLYDIYLLCFKRDYSDVYGFLHVFKDFVKIWTDCFTTWVKVSIAHVMFLDMPFTG
ncbi:hypothetical protein V6N12_007055 [Hibiscus sabdariffa]|uniref:Uncharacterized protein n=1 Tax=Hibiscus sabdariffa TaxID=183260 RepID=A0ABR2F0L8_9ROSI